MKIKFKIDAWTTIERKNPKSTGFFLTPNIEFQSWRHMNGWWFTIIFSWLIFGITFDWKKRKEK